MNFRKFHPKVCWHKEKKCPIERQIFERKLDWKLIFNKLDMNSISYWLGDMLSDLYQLGDLQRKEVCLIQKNLKLYISKKERVLFLSLFSRDWCEFLTRVCFASTSNENPFRMQNKRKSYFFTFKENNSLIWFFFIIIIFYCLLYSKL